MADLEFFWLINLNRPLPFELEQSISVQRYVLTLLATCAMQRATL
jgi:uncharacterized protein YhhL (DUF1145 family)